MGILVPLHTLHLYRISCNKIICCQEARSCKFQSVAKLSDKDLWQLNKLGCFSSHSRNFIFSLCKTKQNKTKPTNKKIRASKSSLITSQLTLLLNVIFCKLSSCSLWGRGRGKKNKQKISFIPSSKEPRRKLKPDKGNPYVFYFLLLASLKKCNQINNLVKNEAAKFHKNKDHSFKTNHVSTVNLQNLESKHM